MLLQLSDHPCSECSLELFSALFHVQYDRNVTDSYWPEYPMPVIIISGS